MTPVQPSRGVCAVRVWSFRVFIGMAVLVAAFVASSAHLYAHGALKSSTPARADTLQAAPGELRLTFTERVELTVSRVVLVRNATDTIALAPLQSESNGFVVVARIAGEAPSGDYVIHWTVAGADGHPVRGTIPFVIAGGMAPVLDTGVTATNEQVAEDSHAHGGEVAAGAFASNAPFATVLRGLMIAGVLLFVGAVLAMTRIVPLLDTEAAITRVATVGAAMGCMLVVVDLLRLYVQRASLGMNGDTFALTTVLDTTWGRGWMLHLAGAVTGALLFWIARRAVMPAQRLLLWAALLQLVFGTSLGGHAAAAARPFLAVGNDVIHVIAAGAWVGMLAIVLLVVWPTIRNASALRLRVMRTFSATAVAAVGVLLVTGLASTWIHHGIREPLWQTDYGRVLLLKLAAVLVMVLLGARNRQHLRVSVNDVPGSVRARAWIELSLTLLVVCATAVLAATPTPPGALHGG